MQQQDSRIAHWFGAGKKTHVSLTAIEKWIEKQARFIVYGTFWNVCHCARPKEMWSFFCALFTECSMNVMPNRSCCAYIGLCEEMRIAWSAFKVQYLFLCLSHLNFFKRPKVFFVSCCPFFFRSLTIFDLSNHLNHTDLVFVLFG